MFEFTQTLKKKTSKLLATAATTAALLTLGAISAQANPFMNVGGYTSIPIGHAIFCQTSPAECAVKSRKDKRIHLTQKKWDQLLDINHAVNTKVRPVTDADLYGVEEHWTYPGSAGDCEDYVLLKRKLLMQRGWPAGALLITVVRQPNGEGHAVLTVRTDRGDLVLDNLEQRVSLWNETPYHYIKRQARAHSGRWETINDTRVSVVGSVN